MSDSPYSKWSFKDIKAEVRRRNLRPLGDVRRRSVLLTALEHDDRSRQAKQVEAKERKEHAEGVKSVEDMTDLEQVLAAKIPTPDRLTVIRDDSLARNRVDEQFRVRNLPADYVYGWASLSAGNGEDIGNWTTLGWIRADADMVTNDPSNTRKIYVSNYEEWNGYVRNRDCLLMIANRRIVEQRKKARQDAWNARVEGMYGKRDSDSPTRDTVSDPTQSTGASFKRVAQWRAEDGLKGE